MITTEQFKEKYPTITEQQLGATYMLTQIDGWELDEENGKLIKDGAIIYLQENGNCVG